MWDTYACISVHMRAARDLSVSYYAKIDIYSLHALLQRGSLASFVYYLRLYGMTFSVVMCCRMHGVRACARLHEIETYVVLNPTQLDNITAPRRLLIASATQKSVVVQDRMVRG